MIYRRERPKCRKALIFLMKEYDCSLQELLNHDRICLSDGLRVQARKMLQEGSFHTAKELNDLENYVLWNKAVGLIK